MQRSNPSAVSIASIGVHLPPDVRTNDFWPSEVVDKWREEQTLRTAARRTLGASSSSANAISEDPFRGAIERRALAPGLKSSHMEIEAAREALDKSGVPADAITFVLGHSMVPDYVEVSNACLVHRALGLRPDAFVTSIEGACNSFMMQMQFADAFLRSGHEYGLIFQSVASSRIMLPEDHMSSQFGDASTALVVRRSARADRGLVAMSTYADASRHDAIVIGIPGKNWFENGRVRMYTNEEQAVSMLLSIKDRAKTSLEAAFAKSGVRADQIDFFACHQPTPWLRTVLQEHAGMTRARSLDTFRYAGNLSACNLPFILESARREGTLKEGDLVAMFSGGAGETWSAATFRWN